MVVQVEKGEDGEPPAEDQAFLGPSNEKRYINVQPANTSQNVYEDVHHRPDNGKYQEIVDLWKQ